MEGWDDRAVDDGIEVAVWLALRGRGEVLAVRPHEQDLFFLPGGLIEPGESAVEVAAREVFEEVGHHLPSSALRELGTVVDHAVGRPGTRLTLTCCAGGPLPRFTTPGEEEIAEIAWIAPAQQAALCAPVLQALAAFGGPAWRSAM